MFLQLYTLNAFADNEASNKIIVIVSIEKIREQQTYINAIIVSVLYIVYMNNNKFWKSGIR